MNKTETIRNHFEKKKKSQLKALRQAKMARDSAPSAMESHHDTTRNQNERLVIALEENILVLDAQISAIPKTDPVSKNNVGLWSYIEFTLDDKLIIKAIIVPEDMGGAQIVDIKLLSTNSPLGKCLLNKKNKEEITFNEAKGKILKIN